VEPVEKEEAIGRACFALMWIVLSAWRFAGSLEVDRFVVISGCSGGGKSTLLAELGRRGHAVVEEPGRRIVKDELKGSGSAPPWVDEAAFARRAVTMALADRASASARKGWVFFDRGLVDAAAELQRLTGEPALQPLRQSHRYHWRVFLAPPWREIHVTDPERRHGFDAALAEYLRLLKAYPSLGYEVLVLPKVGVAERADFVLSTLAE
jgi:predicted ATPase